MPQSLSSISDPNIASATCGGREVSKTILYVGTLARNISERQLKTVMQAAGPVVSAKTLPDKNKPEFNYAFVEFADEQAAAAALLSFDKTMLNGHEVTIRHAYQSSTFASSQTADGQSFSVFVGDLSLEVDDEALHKFFSEFGSLKQAHVMWDMQTLRSRGYGFATFRDAVDAQTALHTMNGRILHGRAVRLNWASHKLPAQKAGYRGYDGSGPGFIPAFAGAEGFSKLYAPQSAGSGSRAALVGQEQAGAEMSLTPQFDIAARQAPSWQTTVYLGNIAYFTLGTDLIPLLQNFGYILDLKFYPDKGCAFVKFDSHERAALAIVQLAGFNLNGRPLKCGWGKSRPLQSAHSSDLPKPPQMFSLSQ
ncbi:RNA-binding domain-containing protein [Metschnikowia bicuspidata]|uniref:RNA-binding domain-containing protein n=1 Tax=Metschnikowia bicuspidata TaxID=27322 RepID=A0A4P9ZF74_9ASCO|nr:RNA-binding domain-containing protein [Metschnikowia bicuspidata]